MGICFPEFHCAAWAAFHSDELPSAAARGSCAGYDEINCFYDFLVWEVGEHLLDV